MRSHSTGEERARQVLTALALHISNGYGRERTLLVADALCRISTQPQWVGATVALLFRRTRSGHQVSAPAPGPGARLRAPPNPRRRVA